MKSIIGEVISAKMISTAVVQVKRFYRYPLYGKIIARKGKIHAHNGLNAREGQQVEITPCRPYAKTVAFEITKVIGTVKSKIKPVTEQSNLTNPPNLTNKRVATKSKPKPVKNNKQ